MQSAGRFRFLQLRFMVFFPNFSPQILFIRPPVNLSTVIPLDFFTHYFLLAFLAKASFLSLFYFLIS